MEDHDSETHERENRFSHLLKPIRDLAKNWDINIAEDLENYLEELEAVTVSFEGGASSLNFAEAAALIQGSTCVYSKKVEYLYDLIHRTLMEVHLLSKERRARRKTTSMRDDGVDDDALELADTHLLLLDDVIREARATTLDLADNHHETLAIAMAAAAAAAAGSSTSTSGAAGAAGRFGVADGARSPFAAGGAMAGSVQRPNPMAATPLSRLAHARIDSGRNGFRLGSSAVDPRSGALLLAAPGAAGSDGGVTAAAVVMPALVGARESLSSTGTPRGMRLLDMSVASHAASGAANATATTAAAAAAGAAADPVMDFGSGGGYFDGGGLGGGGYDGADGGDAWANTAPPVTAAAAAAAAGAVAASDPAASAVEDADDADDDADDPWEELNPSSSSGRASTFAHTRPMRRGPTRNAPVDPRAVAAFGQGAMSSLSASLVSLLTAAGSLASGRRQQASATTLPLPMLSGVGTAFAIPTPPSVLSATPVLPTVTHAMAERRRSRRATALASHKAVASAKLRSAAPASVDSGGDALAWLAAAAAENSFAVADSEAVQAAAAAAAASSGIISSNQNDDGDYEGHVEGGGFGGYGGYGDAAADDEAAVAGGDAAGASGLEDVRAALRRAGQFGTDPLDEGGYAAGAGWGTPSRDGAAPNSDDLLPSSSLSPSLPYEELVKRYRDSFLAEAARAVETSDLVRRVQAWSDEMSVALDEEERRGEFDLQRYGAGLLAACVQRQQAASPDSAATPETAEPRPFFELLAVATVPDTPATVALDRDDDDDDADDADAAGHGHAASSDVHLGDSPALVARSFLALLQLANSGNVELVYPGSCYEGGDDMDEHAGSVRGTSATPLRASDLRVRLLSTLSEESRINGRMGESSDVGAGGVTSIIESAAGVSASAPAPRVGRRAGVIRKVSAAESVRATPSGDSPQAKRAASSRGHRRVARRGRSTDDDDDEDDGDDEDDDDDDEDHVDAESSSSAAAAVVKGVVVSADTENTAIRRSKTQSSSGSGAVPARGGQKRALAPLTQSLAPASDAAAATEAPADDDVIDDSDASPVRKVTRGTTKTTATTTTTTMTTIAASRGSRRAARAIA